MLAVLTSAAYTYAARLVGHTEPILRLAPNSLGTLLASGGMDGTFVWNVAKGTPMRVPPTTTMRGTTTALCWVTGPNDRFETLAIGTSTGYVLLWRQSNDGSFKESCSKRIGQGDEILCIASDETEDVGYRLAIATVDCRVQVWIVDARFEVDTVFSVLLEPIQPRAMMFTPDDAKNLLLFGLEDGNIHRIDAQDGHFISSKDIGIKMNTASVDTKKKHVLIDDVDKGFCLYSIANGGLIQLYQQKNLSAQRRVPKEAVFAENGDVIVGGSNHGQVYVWHRKSGKLLQQIKHPDGGMVQTVAAFGKNGDSFIASASTGENDAISIYIWRKTGPINGSIGTEFYNKYVRNTVHNVYRVIIRIILFVLCVLLSVGAGRILFDTLLDNMGTFRDVSVETYRSARFTARNFYDIYLWTPPKAIPVAAEPAEPVEPVEPAEPAIRVAWEAKKEVELLRETVEIMFMSFGDTLRDALQNIPKAQEGQALHRQGEDREPLIEKPTEEQHIDRTPATVLMDEGVVEESVDQ